MTDGAKPIPRREQFIERLEALVGGGDGSGREDRAALARLKRCAGRRLEECPEAFSLFYRLLPPAASQGSWEESACFLVATLFPLAPERGWGNLGESLRKLADHAVQERGDEDARASLDRRMTALLDCSAEQLPFRLRQTIRLLESKTLTEDGKRIGIDWRTLLDDVIGWSHPDRYVQKRWARGYFGGFVSRAAGETPGESGVEGEEPEIEETE
jgi:CRISPR system Cascade subunit CasB